MMADFKFNFNPYQYPYIPSTYYPQYDTNSLTFRLGDRLYALIKDAWPKLKHTSHMQVLPGHDGDHGRELSMTIYGDEFGTINESTPFNREHIIFQKIKYSESYKSIEVLCGYSEIRDTLYLVSFENSDSLKG